MLKQKFQSELETMIVKQARLNKSIANLITCAVEGVLTYGSVLQKKLAQPLSSGKILFASAVRKMERFFANTLINNDDISRLIVKSLNTCGKVTLAMDRTTWRYGKSPINLFVVAIIWNNSAIPIIWDVLNKMGGSSIAERKRIMRRLISLIGIENIEAVLADREFIGYEWFDFLHRSGVPFIIRIKNGSYVTDDCGWRIQAKTLMKITSPRGRWESNAQIGKVPVRLVGTGSVNGNLVIVAASKSIAGDALNHYRMRWLIELCFKSLKTKGFNMEETHITDPERIKKLFAIIALACLFVVKAGSLRALFKKIPVKNHGRPLYSIFTYGLDLIRDIFASNLHMKNSPPIHRAVLDRIFLQNSKKGLILGEKSVGY